MYHLKIFSVGRAKESWIEEGVEEYITRLKGTASVETVWVKDNQQLATVLERERLVICLDPKGKARDSLELSDYLFDQWEKGGARLAFVIGGSDGLPESLRKKYPLISFSKLTFTHQLTRLILIEQVYRAFQIRRGSPYHK